MSLPQERRYFHPVMGAEALLDQPLMVELLGQKLVLWRDETGRAQAFDDRCPHRGAALSMGCIRVHGVQQVLTCGYHGWRFDSSGQCVQVPAQPAWMPGPHTRATRYDCLERAQMIWVRLAPAGEGVDLTEWPELFEEGWTTAISGPYEVPTSAPRLVENFLDMTHFGFIHGGFLGDLAHTELAPYEVMESAEGVSVPDCAVWQPQAFEESSAEERGQWVHYSYEVTSPYVAHLRKLSADSSSQLAIVMLNCPISDEQTRTWFWIAAQGLDQTPQQMAAFQDTIFAQDAPIVCSQRPKRLPLLRGEQHGPLDRVSAAYRRFLLRVGVRTGVLAD